MNSAAGQAKALRRRVELEISIELRVAPAQLRVSATAAVFTIRFRNVNVRRRKLQELAARERAAQRNRSFRSWSLGHNAARASACSGSDQRSSPLRSLSDQQGRLRRPGRCRCGPITVAAPGIQVPGAAGAWAFSKRHLFVVAMSGVRSRRSGCRNLCSRQPCRRIVAFALSEFLLFVCVSYARAARQVGGVV